MTKCERCGATSKWKEIILSGQCHKNNKNFFVVDKRLIDKKNGDNVFCFCGKECQTYIKTYKNKFENLKKEFFYKFIKIPIHYPRVTCHCRCGARWGKHETGSFFQENQKDIINHSLTPEDSTTGQMEAIDTP